MKTLWAMVQGDAVFMRRFMGWLTIALIILVPVSFLTGWIKSVMFVSVLSEIALVMAAWLGWQAGRVEVKQDDQEG